MKTVICIIAVCLFLGLVDAFTPSSGIRHCIPQKKSLESSSERFPTLFAKDALDELSELDGEETEGEVVVAETSTKKKKKKTKAAVKLEPEVTIFEGAPSPTEIILPAVSVITIIGIIPFAAAVSRQIWVKYKITSRRISVTSGIGGKDLTEIIYPEIRDMKFIYRAFGAAGDVAITLNDGSKLEIRSLPNFEELYQYIYDKLSPDAQEESDKMNKTQ